jgi:hypothetical protein
MMMRNPHDAENVENIHKQIEYLLSWAPDSGMVEIGISFQDGKITKTEERWRICQ